VVVCDGKFFQTNTETGVAMMSESNKQQAVNKLTEIVANFTAMISTRMPDDVVDKLRKVRISGEILLG
jgi:L(+)-tartrate dehydratase alpha subunit